MTMHYSRLRPSDLRDLGTLHEEWVAAGNPKAADWIEAPPQPSPDAIWGEGQWIVPESVTEPRWVEFSTTLMADPAVNTMLGSLLTAAPGLYGGLVVGLQQASQGDDRVFLSAWAGAEGLGLVSAELRDAIYGLAAAADLPILQQFLPPPQSVGQEHTTPDGQLWRVIQARDPDGQFTSDDPATPERESLEWVRVSAS